MALHSAIALFLFFIPSFPPKLASRCLGFVPSFDARFTPKVGLTGSSWWLPTRWHCPVPKFPPAFPSLYTINLPSLFLCNQNERLLNYPHFSWNVRCANVVDLAELE